MTATFDRPLGGWQRKRKLMCSPRRFLGVALVIGLAVAGAGCGDNEQAPSDADDGAASGTASGVAAGECHPVGTKLEGKARETVSVGLDEYTFRPASIKVQAGTVTFEAENVGEENHELAFLPGGGDVPLTSDGVPDEDALAEAGAFELEAFGPGQTCNATYKLEPDTYTLFCIVEAPDGTTHLSKGMRGRLVVGEPAAANSSS
ncbi:MAG: plastocyanin/azurin family copper-binding protein [Egibacteraceae bacterium]